MKRCFFVIGRILPLGFDAKTPTVMANHYTLCLKMPTVPATLFHLIGRSIHLFLGNNKGAKKTLYLCPISRRFAGVEASA
jgi:hypothetical protein